VVIQKFVEEQTQVPFDFAQGGLSTAIGAQYAPISAQDDSLFFDANFRLRTLEGCTHATGPRWCFERLRQRQRLLIEAT
jgi:hypothetical protein